MDTEFLLIEDNKRLQQENKNLREMYEGLLDVKEALEERIKLLDGQKSSCCSSDSHP